MKTNDFLLRIASTGSSLIVNTTLTSDFLLRLASAMKPNCTMTINHADKLSSDTIQRIANAGKERVIFDFNN